MSDEEPELGYATIGDSAVTITEVGGTAGGHQWMHYTYLKDGSTGSSSGNRVWEWVKPLENVVELERQYRTERLRRRLRYVRKVIRRIHSLRMERNHIKALLKVASP